MASAIDKYVSIAINKRFYNSIRISYSETENVNSVDEIKHNIFREALLATSVGSGLELVSVSDVPSQCGLGTSSTFTVALLNGLYAYKKRYISSEELAETACELEINVLNQHIGKQDQYAATFGGFNAYYFNKDGTVEVEPVAISEGNLYELQNNMLLFYLNSDRYASEILKNQDDKSKQEDKNVLEMLHKIKEIGLYTKGVFERGAIDDFGEILHEHWLTKKGLSKNISNSLIDEAYDLALKNGAIGGKVVGAGGGGFLLLYCNKGKERLVSAMDKLGYKPMWIKFENDGAKIIFNG
jgi:D-glycero-alpha-D-manno-heptose-7-phosphate kinase